MNYIQLKEYISSDKIDAVLHKLVVEDLAEEKKRYLNLLDEAYHLYGDGDYHFISSPGRTEIGGNHTDHQHGHVLAASVNIDNLAIVKSNNSNIVNYRDKLFAAVEVDINDLEINESEYNTSKSLIRGIAAKIKQLNYQISGFDALCDSKVLIGSGISSSACFEVMIAEIFNSLFNENKINPVVRAEICQYAENQYFGKPSGLLDQMAISVGGFVAIDFKDSQNVRINSYDFSFSDYGYELLLVNTKGDHADLSNEYAAVPNEMKEVANCLGVNYLADTSFEELLDRFSDIRKEINNDRALLRALHFFMEDKRADDEAKACENKDIEELLKLMRQSGKSSFEYLQNVYPSSRPASQSLAIALFFADYILQEQGAYRVHGGGFDGTIQAVVPEEKYNAFKNMMDNIFGNDALMNVKVRPIGVCQII